MTNVLYVFLLLAGHYGQVIFAGIPVPGATVTAAQGEKKFATVTDEQGVYSFPDLADAPFTIQIEMLGFSTIKQEMNTPKGEFELKMVSIEELHTVVRAAYSGPAPGASTDGPGNTRESANQPRPQAGFQQTEVNASEAAQPANTAPTSSAFANSSQENLNRRAADGFLINGSVSNAAASPFAQIAQFGNNRRSRPLYTGNASYLIENSALNARAYSLTGQRTPKPPYNRFTGSFSVGGPLIIPGLIRNSAPTFFLAYQRTQNRKANTLSGRMPTVAERNGDFSQTVNSLGQPVQVVDPSSGLPFPGNLISEERISPQARALLSLFPLPNFSDNARYNYQIANSNVTHQDSMQGRVGKSINPRNQLTVNVDVQNARSDSSNLFHFLDRARIFGLNGSAQWTTRPARRFSATFRYQFNRQSSRLTPYFANQINVSGRAGITGNNQEMPNWGPPRLNFSGGTSSLADGQYSFNRTQNNTFAYSSFWSRGRSNLTFGADVRGHQVNLLSQQDARGTFTFTGSRTGYDLAGFLLGIPDTSSIAFGNADKYFRQMYYNAFINDDYRLSGALTLNLGARWEYEATGRELRGRLVNLNVARDFASITPVAGNGLLKPDRFGIQPRISFAWRPIAASSLIVRGAYGTYRNTNVYEAIATQMAQQAPFSKSLSVQNSPANPLTLANGFENVPGVTPNTFAVDPNFRVGYVQSWQLSVQQDLPADLQLTGTYSGTKGARLPQEILPNTFPSGAVSPSGYVYLSSNGKSIRNFAQIQLRRRLRGGFTATGQYIYARAFDNAPLMSGGIVTANQGGTSIAQNWLDLKAERAPSNFDQRHQLSAETQYTSGVGVRGGGVIGGWKGVLLREWTLATQLHVGTGLPLTPVYLAPVPGTGITGNLRPDATGVPAKDARSGLFLNPEAFRVPAVGQWGNAARNSIRGSAQFSLNASLGRSFPWRDRYNIDVRIDATNILNRVTVKNWNTILNNAQFGLPSQVDPMRSIQTIVRLRF